MLSTCWEMLTLGLDKWFGLLQLTRGFKFSKSKQSRRLRSGERVNHTCRATGHTEYGESHPWENRWVIIHSSTKCLFRTSLTRRFNACRFYNICCLRWKNTCICAIFFIGNVAFCSFICSYLFFSLDVSFIPFLSHSHSFTFSSQLSIGQH